MSAEVRVLGVRHHGPGSARMVVRALEGLKPDAILIEGPPDAAEVLSLATKEGMTPPVALLIYEPEEPRNACYYPFAEFSPEWQAIRWGQRRDARVQFMDLPQSLRPGPKKPAPAEEAEEEGAGEVETAGPRYPSDPLDAMALAAGYPDGEAWWGRLIEERRGEEDPASVFDAIREAMGELRAHRDGEPAAGTRSSPFHIDADEPAREAHMRKSIRIAMKEGFERIAVV